MLPRLRFVFAAALIAALPWLAISSGFLTTAYLPASEQMVPAAEVNIAAGDLRDAQHMHSLAFVRRSRELEKLRELGSAPLAEWVTAPAGVSTSEKNQEPDVALFTAATPGEERPPATIPDLNTSTAVERPAEARAAKIAALPTASPAMHEQTNETPPAEPLETAAISVRVISTASPAAVAEAAPVQTPDVLPAEAPDVSNTRKSAEAVPDPPVRIAVIPLPAAARTQAESAPPANTIVAALATGKTAPATDEVVAPNLAHVDWSTVIPPLPKMRPSVQKPRTVSRRVRSQRTWTVQAQPVQPPALQQNPFGFPPGLPRSHPDPFSGPPAAPSAGPRAGSFP